MTTIKTKPAEKTEFEFYAPEAQRVSVAGTSNYWNEENEPLKKDAAGKWKLALLLSPGRYEYRYLVDGVWQNDQRPVECIPNAFGTRNCVVNVK